MIALAVTLSILILIALLRFGVIVEYSKAGFEVWVKAGFLKFKTVGEDLKDRNNLRELRKKLRKKIKKNIQRDNSYLKEMIPGSMDEFTTIIKSVFNLLERFKRRLLIKQLTLYYTSAAEDPANTALMYGGSNAVFAAVVPEIKKRFRVKRIDLRSWFDFTAAEQGVYAKINISIAVWEVVYALFALGPVIKSIFKKRPKTELNKQKKNDRKDGQNNGKTTDQRTDGHDNAKNEGND